MQTEIVETLAGHRRGAPRAGAAQRRTGKHEERVPGAGVFVTESLCGAEPPVVVEPPNEQHGFDSRLPIALDRC